MTPLQVIVEAKNWDLTTKEGCLIFTDFLEEQGEAEFCFLIRHLVVYWNKNGGAVGEWLAAIQNCQERWGYYQTKQDMLRIVKLWKGERGLRK